MGQHKSLSGVEIKSVDLGQVEAVFSTFNVVDKDGDVTMPGAFTEGQEVAISAYGHGSWQGALPVGKGTIHTTRSQAVLRGQFFMDTAAGRDTFAVVKELGAKQQWSYGFDVLHPPETGKFAGQPANFLRKLLVHEVSPTLLGAGVNTRTLTTKAAKDGTPVTVMTEYAAAIRPHETPVSRKAWDFAGAAALIPEDASINDLRAMHAWVAPSGDPAKKSSYDFLHHDSPTGPANMRACVAGIGRLAKGAHSLPDVEALAVQAHLRQHLDDGDIELPELDSESVRHKESLVQACLLAEQAESLARLAETRSSRAQKGKALSALSVLLLEWQADVQRATKALLDSPQEDADREYARFVQSLTHGGTA